MKPWAVCLAPLAALLAFAVCMHAPVFLAGKTVSAADLAYSSFGAYAGVEPPGFAGPRNRLLFDPFVQFEVWDLAMFEGPLGFPHLWNPYAGFGSPLLANSQCAPLFPLKLLLYPLAGVRRGFGLLCVAKMALAGLGMWAYLRALGLGRAERLVGALAFMACGFMVTWLQWPHTNVALLLPGFMLGAEWLAAGRARAGFALILACVALGLLGGHPETLFHIAAATGLYLLARLGAASLSRYPGCAQLEGETPASRSGARAKPGFSAPLATFAAAVAVGALLAAVQLLPTLEYLHSSAVVAMRGLLQPQSHGLRAALAPANWGAAGNECLTYLLPNTFGNPSIRGDWWNPDSNFNESAGYVGIGVLLLACFGWRLAWRSPVARALILLQGLSLGFILNLPVVVQTLGRLPPLNLAANKRFLLVFCFSNAALAAVSLQDWRTQPRVRRRDAAWLACLVAGAVAAITWRYADAFRHNPHGTIRAFGHQQLVHALVFLGLTVATLTALRLRRRVAATAAAALLVLITAADLFRIHYGYNPFLDPATLYPSTPAIRFLQGQEQARVAPVGWQIGPNLLTAYGVEDARIYDAVTFTPLALFLADMGTRGTWNVLDTAPTPLSSIAGVRYLWSDPAWTAAGGATTPAYADATQRIVEDRAARPLAYVASRWVTVSDPNEARRRLIETPLSRNLVVVEPAAPGTAVPPDPPQGPEPASLLAARVVRESPTRTRVDLPASSGGLLVLNDCAYPGWRARVDGRPAPIVRANGLFRGVFLPTGATRVDFTYAPASFRLGAGLSLATALALLLAWGRIPAETASNGPVPWRRRLTRWRKEI